ncbi:Cys-tRNA(Pro) deacylase [Azospirillum rugosum]|uniref:Cys-tRNA(Pro)/Cys-tRNA(Cys) deacylase n=1 Tax=Azospirillum rugosum TaxID=416170 RepID=A0ABS4STM7_9PROT|nr:Cys-tRNA(Pro) deacylase [Azospirillum rugosum]MBP2295579.1 Cys-tRNA(Pro)/Cys-tRNA(Cys) deacylase [Azospirillum rugosum]MDQ0529531.1 Cys-tRNA(Pro)/Cys-tRNA(Cys) deacylase [Azospirillum rugosum]
MAAKVTPAVNAAKAAGIAHRLLEYDYDPSADAIGLHAAAALGLDPAIVYKTLIVQLEPKALACVVIPVAAKLDLKALAAAAGAKKADLADPTLAERTTGYLVGGISPLGQRKALPTFIDASAESLPEMVVNGGRRGLQIVLAPADLARATKATVKRIVVG